MGLPTILDRPTTTACLPLSSTPWRRRISMPPAGVAGVKKGPTPSGRPTGATIANRPALTSCTPSTSLSGERAAFTTPSSIPLGIGSCTKMPWTLGSVFSLVTRATNSSWGAVSGSTWIWASMPRPAIVFLMALAYHTEPGSSPALTTAMVGVTPYFSLNAATSSSSSARMVLARARPSRISAVIRFLLCVKCHVSHSTCS